MRILFIAPQVPFPLTSGGNIRMFYLLRNYAAQHEVTLLCLCRTPEELRFADRLREWCKEVIVVPVPGQATGRNSLPMPLLAVKALSPIPDFLRRSRSVELETKLASLSLNAFDIVHIERLHWMLSFLPFLKQIRGIKVLDLHDIEFVILRRRIPHICSGRGRLLARLDQAKLRWLERWAVKQFDLCLVCSEADAARLQGGKNGSRVLVVPNGVDSDQFRPQPHLERSFTVLYLGSMDWWPNEDAVLHFAKAIWPQIRRELKEARFLVAGRKPGPAILELRGRDGIDVLGEVPDQIEAFAQCSVFVAPLRVGSGTRVKILEVMAMGKPVVSTSIGCEGLEVESGRHLVVADDPDIFARQCLRLLSDDELRKYLGHEGRALVEERYRWEQVLLPLSRALDLCQGPFRGHRVPSGKTQERRIIPRSSYPEASGRA